jgi:ATP-dependent RNA helicase RhlE
VLAGRDLLGAAQTGTGKTAGFALPILQRLSAGANGSHSPARHPVRALVVTPTRELAAQVEGDIRTYGKHLSIKSTIVFGGVGIQPQIDALRRGVDILVATPGRLLDHVQQKTVDLRKVEILVLDEADRMLDMGFINDIRKILALLPAVRQNLLFSATFPDEIRKLAGSFMKNPVTVEVMRRNTPAELVAQVQHPVSHDRKRELLAHLVKSNDWRQVLVFVKTKHGANRLAQQLERSGIEADAIHGNKAQNHRTRTLKRFKDNELRVLVATDIAARGLDIEALPHVVNYDMPHVAEDYVHRIGRTGRAGAEGEAVSLVTHEERPLMAAIEKLMNRKVEQRVIEGFEPGTRSQNPEENRAEDRDNRGNRGQSPNSGRRQQQQPRQRQGQQRRPEQRHGQPKLGGNGHGGNRGQSPRSQDSGSQRFNGQRRGGRPGNGAAALPAQIAKEREAQIAEARARMVAEGEPVPAAPEPAKRSRYEPQLGGSLGNKRRDQG